MGSFLIISKNRLDVVMLRVTIPYKPRRDSDIAAFDENGNF